MLLYVTLTNISKSTENSGHQLDLAQVTLVSPAFAHGPPRAQALCHASPAHGTVPPPWAAAGQGVISFFTLNEKAPWLVR